MSTPSAPPPTTAQPTTTAPTASTGAPQPQSGGAPPPGGGSGAPPPGPGTGGGDGGTPQPGGAQQGDTQQPASADNTAGTSDTARQATARPGQGSLRAGLLRTAWTHIGGDRVEGDKIVIHADGERGVVLRALAAGNVDTVRRTFQAPPRWDDVVADAWRRRSVVLRGPGGAGKTAAAVRLLISAQAKAFYLLDSVAELTRLTELKQLGRGAGLLLDRPVDLGELRGSQLAGLEDLLSQAEAHLVLIAGPEAELGHGVGEYVQRIGRPDILHDVLLAHLTHRLGEDDAERALAAVGVQDLCEELLDVAAACRDAARLAEVIGHEHGAGLIDAERVRARMDQTGGEGPEEWFEGLGDTGLRTHAVALAVLGGLPQEYVAMAASTLLDRFRSDRGVLRASVEQGPVPLRQDPFSQSRRMLDEKLRARTVTAVTRGDNGWLPCTVAEYRNPDYPARIIRHAWAQYTIQGELLDWLAELVDKPSQQVRSFAGTALGLIATESFDAVSTLVLPGWIRDEASGEQRREAIAYALRVCARDPDLRPGVRALVEGWYLGGPWQFQAAAARAYGLCLGGADLPTALQALTRLGTVDSVQIAIAIGDAVADLMEEDVRANAPAVLRALAEMAHEPKSRHTGHLAFLILANALVTDEPPAGGLPGRSRPTLLRLAADSPPGGELRRLIGYLWAEAISGEVYSEPAGTVLEAWATQAETDPELLADLVRILVDEVAARSPRAGLLLQRYAAHWTDRDRFRPLPRSAAVLGAALRTAPSARPTQPGGDR
ncbi:hypothetical protein ABZ915_37370 [Streptomyces sp. NPDC046915]|uniref:hypothetical protein n=1 Tax=Streptomyces sp. NPDC046915 TaxID=3155257 RepID=UPI0033E099E3